MWRKGQHVQSHRLKIAKFGGVAFNPHRAQRTSTVHFREDLSSETASESEISPGFGDNSNGANGRVDERLEEGSGRQEDGSDSGTSSSVQRETPPLPHQETNIERGEDYDSNVLPQREAQENDKKADVEQQPSLGAVFSAKLKILSWKKNIERKRKKREGLRDEAERHVGDIQGLLHEIKVEDIDNLDYRLQGNLETYTHEALRQREHISHDKRLNLVIQNWWETFILPVYDKDGDNKIQRGEYKVMYRALRKVMKRMFQLNYGKRMTRRMAREEEQRDWESDIGDAEDMDLSLFQKSIFELVDHWCDEIRVEKYIELVDELFSTMQESEYKKKVKTEEEEEVKESITVANGPKFHVRVSQKIYKSVDFSIMAQKLKANNLWKRGFKRFKAAYFGKRNIGTSSTHAHGRHDGNAVTGSHSGASVGVSSFNDRLAHDPSLIFNSFRRPIRSIKRNQVQDYCANPNKHVSYRKVLACRRTSTDECSIEGNQLPTQKAFRFVEGMGAVHTKYRVAFPLD